MFLPTTVAHADWSTHPRKRWIARAHLQADGRYLVSLPEPVGEPKNLIGSLQAEAPALVGFDFPIGLPLPYALQVGVTDFLELLPQLGSGNWSDFYRVAESPVEISLHRPFYPARPGSARQVHLLNGLGVKHMDELRRQCEKSRPGRRAAAPLFWTMGAQQVGKAAIHGWREILTPCLDGARSASIWPFSGKLEELLEKERLVIAETYPGEYSVHFQLFNNQKERLGQPIAGGKRSQQARSAQAERLLCWSREASVALSKDLQVAIRNGFGNEPEGEDRFDALVGLFGMVEVVLGRNPVGEPDIENIRNVEGWILGQAVYPDHMNK